MTEMSVTTLDGKQSGQIALRDDVFGLTPRADILHRVVKWQLARRRAQARHVQGRSDVAATGAKLYRQKGTGRARHSDRKAPIFRGGGKAFGPMARSFGHKLPKKIRALGLRHALSAKSRAGEIVIIDALMLNEHRTKLVLGKLRALALEDCLFVDRGRVDANFARAVGNLPYIDVLPLAGINVYSILRRRKLVLTRAAALALNARFMPQAAELQDAPQGEAQHA